MKVREEEFKNILKQNNIDNIQKIIVDETPKGGYDGVKEVAAKNQLPECILCSSDNIAHGALKAFHFNEIKIPQQPEFISISNGNK